MYLIQYFDSDINTGLQLAGQPDSLLKQSAIIQLRQNNTNTSVLEYWLNPDKKKLTDQVSQGDLMRAHWFDLISKSGAF